jgi:hypothetical protein
MAPDTPHGASLEKDIRPETRAIIDGETLNIGD